MQEIKAIFPEPYEGIQVNYCVSADCENFGHSDPSLYKTVVNNRKLNIYHCPKCGAYPQVVNNRAVYQAIEYQKKYHGTVITACTNERCSSHSLAVHAYPHKYRAFGKTKTLKQRYQCRECSTVFTDRFSGTNRHVEVQNALFYGMKYGQGVRNLCTIENITPNTFYTHQRNMVDRLKYLAQVRECVFYQQVEDCSLSCNYRFVKEVTGAMMVATVHNPSGYVLGFDTNLCKDIDKRCLLYSHTQQPVYDDAGNTNDDLVLDILSGYDAIMSRSNYLDPLSGGKRLAQRLPIELTQPYLISFAHALVLHRKLKQKSNRYYFVEQDTLLRNAFINAALETLMNHNDQLFYYKESRKKMEWFDNDKIHVRKIGWWNDKWGFVTDENKTKATCHIKGNDLSPDKWHALTQAASLDGVNRYLQLATGFMGRLIHTVNDKSINDWLHVYTAYYNYCLTDKNGKTPAEQMGFCDRPMGLSELLSGTHNAVTKPGSLI